jgi:EAL domain-containing protein (putative c-di-GMP-specific phosphodiesterase class I)
MQATTDCQLIAEGIETKEEARTLNLPGVNFGKGYLFGHPEPVEVWRPNPRSSRRPECRVASWRPEERRRRGP